MRVLHAPWDGLDDETVFSCWCAEIDPKGRPMDYAAHFGQPFRFFEPVFNFADSCVTVGAFYLILFQYKFFAGRG